jgi:hypothetical protein
MPLLLEQSPTDQGRQNLLGQYVRTILAVVDELVSQMPLEAQIWAEQARQELHAGIELIEQEIELLGLAQICALRRALDERDHQMAELRARLEGPPGPPSRRCLAQPSAYPEGILGGEASLVSPQPMLRPANSSSLEALTDDVRLEPSTANQIPSDTLENLFEDLEGLSVQSVQSSLEAPILSAQTVITDVIQATAVEESEEPFQSIATAEPPSTPSDSSDSETLRQDFQQLQVDLDQQKQQLASIISVADQQKVENQQLQSLVSVLEEKLSQKETDLEKSMIRSLLLEAGLDPDVA